MQYKIKKLGDFYEVILFKKQSLKPKLSGFKELLPEPEWVDCNFLDEYQNRLRESTSRTVRNIREIGFSNSWGWFATLTLDGEKIARDDYEKAWKTISQYIRNLNRRRAVKIRYLVVPELHKDGRNWHFHGLFNGLSDRDFLEINGKLNWKAYYDKFGFSEFSRIRNKDRSVTYIAKYISKGVENCSLGCGKKMYFCSTGLDRSYTVDDGVTLKTIEHFRNSPNVYEGQYCMKITLRDENELESFMKGL